MTTPLAALVRCQLGGRYCAEVATYKVTGPSDLRFNRHAIGDALTDSLGDTVLLRLSTSLNLCDFHTRLVRSVCHADGEVLVTRPLPASRYDLSIYEAAFRGDQAGLL